MMDQAVRLSSSAELTVRAMNAFAFSLHRMLARDGDENLLCSPASIVWALAMVLAGASGQTKRDMVKALGIEYLDVPLGSALAEIDAGTRKGALELHLANAVWRQEGYAFKEFFLKALADDLRARVRFADFADAAGAARRINAWVEEETQGRIRDLLSPRGIAPLTRAILVNAVYFAGRWENEFDEEMTEDRPFWVTPDRSIEVPTMQRTGFYRHITGSKYEAVELRFRTQTYEEVLEETDVGITLRKRVAVPGGGSDFALCVILPEKSGLGAEPEFDVMCAEEIDWRAAQSRHLDLHLPRFTLQSCHGLKRALRAMGFAAAFEQDADFSAATDDPEGLQIDQVIHQAFVRVDEKGAEAAATTAMMLVGGMAEPPKEFKVDRPFVFMIRDVRTGLIYFIGRVTNPIAHLSGGVAA